MLLNAEKNTIVGSTLNAKLTTAFSILLETKDLNKNSLPNCVKEITFTNALLIHSNPEATKSTFRTRTANTNWSAIPFKIKDQLMARLFLLESHPIATRTLRPKKPLRMDSINSLVWGWKGIKSFFFFLFHHEAGMLFRNLHYQWLD